MHHLISRINSPTHFVSHVLIYLLLTHVHTTMIILLRQRHHHHSCYPLPHHSFTLVSKLFFFSNPILHRYLAPPWTDSTAIRTCSRFYVYSFQFFSQFYFSLLFFISYLFGFFLILVVFTSVIFRILSVLHLTLFYSEYLPFHFSFKHFSSF